MTTRSALPAGLGFAATAIVCAACSGGSAATPASPPDDGVTTADAALNPYGVPYPTARLGTVARAGNRPGDRIRNLTFPGYKQGTASLSKDKATTTISLADYFDPEMRNYRLIHLVAGSRWCQPCNAEAQALADKEGDLEAQGVAILQVLLDGTAPGRAATQDDLDAWVTGYGIGFAAALDPGALKLGVFVDPSAVPWSADIDTRSMEILHAGVGYDPDMGSLMKSLAWVKVNRPLAAE
jgi:hypothetical protein